MTSPELLLARDRCARIPFWAKKWEWPKMSFGQSLRRSIEGALTEATDDCGQAAGDRFMTDCADRGLETSQQDLYGQAEHGAALADIITWRLRGQKPPWNRPEDFALADGVKWQSSAFLSDSGFRLYRVCLVSRWTPERKIIETHSYFSLFESAIYGLPLTNFVIVLGQNRDGRHHGYWTKASQHPLNRGLRFKKRSGESFGSSWKQVWREELDTSRDTWLEAMEKDGVLEESCFEMEVKVPIEEIQAKVRGLAARRLREIQETVKTPDPSPSQCWMPTRCQFVDTCWTFNSAPAERMGYVRIS